MNTSRSNRDSRAEDQAALWAAKLDGGSLSSEERASLDVWLAEAPTHRALLSQYCQFSTDLEEQLPELVGHGALSFPVEVGRPRRARRHRVWWVTATLAAAAAVAVMLRPSHPDTARTVATTVAERKSVQLTDGTVVELNARTNLSVDMSGTERHVRMADGEAFFTVAKDKSRPFIIDTPAGSVRVTGTVFDVDTDSPMNLAVTVVEGSVQVSPGDAPERPSGPKALVAGDRLVANSSGVTVQRLDSASLDAALAWRRGAIVFVGTPLSEALARVGRYHGVTITASPDVAGLLIGGSYGLDDLNAFLSGIEMMNPVQVSHESNGTIVVKPRG